MKWSNIARWMLATIFGVVVIAVIGGYFYLKSTAFRQLAMRKIIEQADEATGGRTRIAGFDFQLSTLTAHLYRVVLHGSESESAPPLLTVDKLTIGLKIQSALHRRVNLSELLIEHPVAYVEVNREGESNVPQPPPSQSSSRTSVFDLAVRHAAIVNGEVNYNDRKMLVDADLQRLQTEVSFEPLLRRYRGSLFMTAANFATATTNLCPTVSGRTSALPGQFFLWSQQS